MSFDNVVCAFTFLATVLGVWTVNRSVTTVHPGLVLRATSGAGLRVQPLTGLTA